MQVVGKKMGDAGKDGSNINISSIAGDMTLKYVLLYCVSKPQYGDKSFCAGIRVNWVCPTLINLDLNKQLGEEFSNREKPDSYWTHG